MLQQFAGDGNHVIRCFAQPEYDFGNAMAHGAMVVDVGESQIFERQVPHAMKRRIDIRGPAADFFEENAEFIFRHF